MGLTRFSWRFRYCGKRPPDSRCFPRPGAPAPFVPPALFPLFLGPILYRLLKQGHEPGPFEVVQTGAVILVGFGGALWTAPGSLGVVLGSLGLAAAAGSYALSFSSR